MVLETPYISIMEDDIDELVIKKIKKPTRY